MRRRFKQAETDMKEKILDVDASMQGTLSFNDPVNLRVNGKFDGKLNTKGSLLIGANAKVNADIVGEHVTIAGNVTGNLKARNELRLISPAVVVGNIETPVLSIAEGAILNGNIKMPGAKNADIAKQMLSIDEVADYLEIDKNLVTEWADNGRLPGVKDGKSWRFDRAIVDTWVTNEKIN